MFRSKTIALSGMLSMVLTSLVNAENHTPQDNAEVFLPENAILDTSILFAIGAREAQQELRGSYGWDTFQEGLVEGVYFRFDPDGYARFSPNARLDIDLFEVLCRPRTLNCIARKGPLSVTINPSGLLQLSIEGTSEGDQYFVSDGTTEFELPNKILQPLDARFENVLAVGGDLIMRRGANETGRVSLVGFAAVTAYLRWILAEQNYFALPRSWAVPNGNSITAPNTVTAPQAWRGANGTISASQPSDLASTQSVEVSATLNELTSLKSMVEELAARSPANETAAVADESVSTPTSAPDNEYSNLYYELQKLVARTDAIEREIAEYRMLQMTVEPIAMESKEDHLSTSMMTDETPVTSELVQLAKQIEQISEQFGIDASLAAVLLRLQNENGQGGTNWSNEQLRMLLDISDQAELDGALFETPQLAELPPTEDRTQTDDVVNTDAKPNDFVLLTDYFKSVRE